MANDKIRKRDHGYRSLNARLYNVLRKMLRSYDREYKRLALPAQHLASVLHFQLQLCSDDASLPCRGPAAPPASLRSASLFCKQPSGTNVSLPGGICRANFSSSAASASSTTEKSVETGVLTKKRVVSGAQPTGSIHLGNHLGAIKAWVALQDIYETFFLVVDLRAITMPRDVEPLTKSMRTSAALYISSGSDPTKVYSWINIQE